MAQATANVTYLFLDTAPVIYYVEKHPHYFAAAEFIFERIDAGVLTAVTSPITLAECLVAPYRLGLTSLQQDFFELIVYGRNTQFVATDLEIGRQFVDSLIFVKGSNSFSPGFCRIERSVSL